ncbi:putative TetR family transcriptional regulator [Streptomyces sp. NBRC 110611]|uniref:TetR/AcrR family transcriptional regulator n=1 Tax=Streptomyces sp. NBRC 110611 TaxID=1621259 RepID=UPI00082DFAA9|nr:TetR/AcrR family transcriptional regulator [Streptomyces sp. NBRC 110611]GAU67029.1 putative TetR family transcriptional regulator [Streptomyces sp. NBRC 110611]
MPKSERVRAGVSAPDGTQGPGLRARLVQAGVGLVAEEGAQALSLREIARRAGVSHGAPRRYFPSHLDLLSAIARQGFAELAAQVADVTDAGQTSPRAQLTALGRCYLDFARDHRGMYELMFRHDLLESGRLGLRETSLPLFRVLVDLVARVCPPSGGEPRVVAGALWGNLHGIAQLWGWGSLPLATGVKDVDPLLRAALDAHLGPEKR